jgi:hypothetical protein
MAGISQIQNPPVNCYAHLFRPFNPSSSSSAGDESSPLCGPFMVVLLSLQIAQFEKQAVDASGFPTTTYSHWYNWHVDEKRKVRDYKKLHIMTGTYTNVISAALVYPPLCYGSLAPFSCYLTPSMTPLLFAIATRRGEIPLAEPQGLSG